MAEAVRERTGRVYLGSDYIGHIDGNEREGFVATADRDLRWDQQPAGVLRTPSLDVALDFLVAKYREARA